MGRIRERLTRRPDSRQDSRLDHPRGNGTLGRRLIIQVSAIAAVVAIALTAITTFATWHILVSQLDQQLDTASQRQSSQPGADPCFTEIPGPAQGSKVLGNSVGSVFVSRCANGLTVGSVVTEGQVDSFIRGNGMWIGLNNSATTVSPSLDSGLNTLLDVPSDGRKHGIRLDGLDRYRVLSQTRDGATYVVALPMGNIDRAIKALLILECGGAALAVVASMVISRTVVMHNLKPLNRLASVANHVSRLDLDSGEVNLPVRVDPALADPRTEVGRVGSAFNHMLNNVEGALAARQKSETKVRQFVADASHELRNPLASIRGYAELTRRSEQQLPEDAAHSLSRIEAQATRMSGLVEDMLLLARLDNDQTLDLQPTDLVEVVLNAVSDSQAASTDHTWSLDLPDEPVMVAADPDRLTQVVVNVLSNARKHTPPGTHVHTSVAVEGTEARVVVTDDGPGIPESVRETVFERFARADTSRTDSTEGSTGLGLAIVAAVMEAHHGSAHLDSSERGTTMTLRLPLTG
ncbi:sensor histidine kinase [Acidipropionibacterium jensenii]|uniref:histidine kinase n=1 Tax=Acidipropionibacterium jensenii TaxID=1749 RepID=A0A3Q9UF89_9ACTN|nr:HAMP domain-containing sensor histidine kinase [Acidipropionibacterium jensenii]AZZ40144.1 sensor histidine kinase [Acidipropionibacterium jensenii]QCV87350.1 HAMP domain-containing histidine kinase [Acidipropionibacterium jensenii]